MIRGKKWYWQLFINLINVALTSPWTFHCKVDQDKLLHVEFRRLVTLCLLKADVPQLARAPGGAASLPGDIRYDGMNNILGSTTQGRCKFYQKTPKTTIVNKANDREYNKPLSSNIVLLQGDT